MNPIQAVARMQMNDIKLSLVIFWSILMTIFAFLIVLMHYVPNGTIMMGGANAVYIFCFITAIVTLNEIFPFSLGMNIRRRDFYASSMLVFGIAAVVLSTVLTILAKLEIWLSELMDFQISFFASLFMMSAPAFYTDTIFKEMLSHIVIIFFMMCLGFLIAAIYYRFGKYGMYTISALFTLFIMFIIVAPVEPLLEVISVINSLWKLLLLLGSAAIIFSGISYLLLRKAVVKS